jgi:hypothetical protein
MNPINYEHLSAYIDEKIADFYERRIQLVSGLKLEDLFVQPTYLLLVADGLTGVPKWIHYWLQVCLWEKEEKLFGDFLEGLAVFVTEMTCGGHKSTEQGVDLEFMNKGMHYIVSIKSGINWGNGSQQKKLEQDLKTAEARVKQLKRDANVQPVLGICYGKTKTSYLRGYMKVVGQNFWYLISENPRLYIELVEPVVYSAEMHDELFVRTKAGVETFFTCEFAERFCDSRGLIDWEKLVEFNSGNLDLN